MLVPQENIKCVVFIALKLANGQYRFVGTGSLLYHMIDGKPFKCLATAKHVINGIKDVGLDMAYVRFNLKNGKAKWFEIPIKYWFKNPNKNVDVAICAIRWEDNFDHLYFSLEHCATKKEIAIHEVEAGDDVFIPGLFKNHHGITRNIPIIRQGSIAAMAGDKLQTSLHKMDGHLIECRSIGGLSGSPVFINAQIKNYFILKERKDPSLLKATLLLGIVYGHYNHKNPYDDVKKSKDKPNPIDDFEKLNTGITIVTPAEKVIDTLLKAIKKNKKRKPN